MRANVRDERAEDATGATRAGDLLSEVILLDNILLTKEPEWLVFGKVAGREFLSDLSLRSATLHGGGCLQIVTHPVVVLQASSRELATKARNWQ
ncbi:hypothetical protein PAPYR_7896 [Paratrimastix pyriformis]|uniref:Uncharacterized protein n=1 Tax=Paratrimastix pyriformis TaxID=342808 RepID=A0ABQ8UH80_9EUKA|nr:hypothetical protein PAPYR_7896 [Paratrimastix pyriformis]